MLKLQKNLFELNNLSRYYEYNFKQVNNLDSKFKIYKQYYYYENNINYNKIIFKLLIWFKLKKYKQNCNTTKILNLQQNVSQKEYKQLYFVNIYKKIESYFYKNKIFFKNEEIDKNVDTLEMFLQEIKNNNLDEHLKLSQWKLDRLYSFNQYFNNFSLTFKLKKVVISELKLNDYTLRSKFKTSINFENIKTHYGVIRIKPSGANVFITLTNFNGAVFAVYLLVFLMKFAACNKGV